MIEGTPPPSVSVVIPAFNEESVIARVLDEVRAVTGTLAGEIVVVDDGSTDGTREVLERYVSGVAGVHVIRHPVNRGKAAAIRSALAHVRGDLVLVQDADLEYSPQDYGRLLAPFCDPAVQVVYGSRFLERHWPAKMKVANWVANKVFVAATNALYGSELTDEGTGYKVIRRETLQGIGIASSRFEFCPEVTAKLLRKGVRIVEVPVSYCARDRAAGKKPGLRDGIAVLWKLVSLRFTA